LKYLGEFKLIFENNLGTGSEGWVLLMKKARGRKSHASVPLSDCLKRLTLPEWLNRPRLG
jgi:hypothetical protein